MKKFLGSLFVCGAVLLGIPVTICAGEAVGVSYEAGDANGDDNIDVRDLVRYKKVIAKTKEVSFAPDYSADLNVDGKTNTFDITLMRKILLGETLDNIRFNQKFAVTGPVAEVYPYSDSVKQYVTTENAAIADYYWPGSVQSGDASIADVLITWDGIADGEDWNITKYVVEYAAKEDYSDAITVDSTEKQIAVRNLYKASDYHVRVTAYAGNIIMGQAESAFQTTDKGPRVMSVDSIYNVRDLGGYETIYGKRTLQGMIYRGSEMDGNHDIALSEAGNEYMSKVLGIVHDMDLRKPADCGYVTVSPISSAEKTHYPINGYTDAFAEKYQEIYRQIFAALADKNNYPVYIHCWGGADRTGTVSFLVNALCGVSEEDLIRDYEMTSFSIFGIRERDSEKYDFSGFLQQLKTFEGDTLADQTAAYMESIGVTETEIYNIRAIMFGEETKSTAEVLNTSDYFTFTDSEKITLSEDKTSVESDAAVGYGQKIRLDMQTVTEANTSGRTYVFLGSYGFCLRGGKLRDYTLSASEEKTEVARDTQCTTTLFDSEGAYLEMQVDIEDDMAVMTVRLVNDKTTVEHTYTFDRISDEISSENAKVTIEIDPTAGVSSLNILKK